MLIGEAGGFQDYHWGFGMRYAFETANLAARSIMEAEPSNGLIREKLQAFWNKELKKKKEVLEKT